VGVVVALVAAVVAFVNRPSERATAQDSLGPVLLVPGYGGDEAGLQGLARALRADGRTVQVVSLLGDGRGDLRAQATELGRVADQLLEQTGGINVDVVGYSAGGVVARWWVRFDGGDEVARRVVTISSPHHGTAVAELARELAPDSCPTGCQQLAPASDLLRRLNAGDETPDGTEWVSVWSADDQTVTPPDSAVLDGALDVRVQDVCPGLTLSHAQMPRADAVIAMVVAALGVGTPTEPTSSVCASR
jgi:triacylglycerol lipase